MDSQASPVTAAGHGPAWHTLSVAETASRLHCSAAGLTSEQARRRLAESGPNELQAAGQISPWALLAAQFRNVLIVILLVATALSAFLGHAVEAIAITVIVLFAVLLGFVQEYRAERAIEALKQMAAPGATVLRDGRETEVPAREVVPGDVLLLATGDRIAADGRLIEAVNLQLQEAALTGESVAVEKRSEALDGADLAVGDRRNMVYAGTAATYGRGRALVVATGMATEFGRIARMLETVETGRTPLQANLDRLGHLLARAAFVIVALIVALGLFRGQPFVEMLIFGIALAVAVVPEALPAVVTISLALGVQRLVKRRALMRRLPAVETLGSTSVICSDKTGTLTRDEMTARKLYVAGHLLDVSGAGYRPHGEFSFDGKRVELAPEHDHPLHRPVRELLRAAALASDAQIVRGEAAESWTIRGDPTEGALVVAAAKAGLHKPELDQRFPRRHEIPFASETKRMTTLHEHGEGMVAYAKGAPEVILESCVARRTAEGEVPLDEAHRRAILEAARKMASEALRVLAVAGRSDATPENAEREMTFLGLVGMIDPPRPEAKEAIRTCERAGIRVVMITGDHPVTAQAVADELGILKGGRVVTGAELEQMSDAELGRAAESIAVYARVSPSHKLRVVEALQKQGHVVAMTGDGVNDAPALKRADIGVAMGITGTDVAREAAAMTLTDDNFASIVAAVEEGRGIFGNIKKYLMFLLSSNVGEIGLMAGATLLGLPLPLTAVQILYVNLATDGLPALALAVDPP
jgi:P-type Ca2+ transporter type 2C